jgi:hypothetical protein
VSALQIEDQSKYSDAENSSEIVREKLSFSLLFFFARNQSDCRVMV